MITLHVRLLDLITANRITSFNSKKRACICLKRPNKRTFTAFILHITLTHLTSVYFPVRCWRSCQRHKLESTKLESTQATADTYVLNISLRRLISLTYLLYSATSLQCVFNNNNNFHETKWVRYLSQFTDVKVK